MIIRYRLLATVAIALFFFSPILIIYGSIENVSAYSMMGSGVNGNQEILCDPTRPLVYLADPTGDTVAIYNYTANTTTIVHVGLYPMSLDLSRDRSYLYVAVSGNNSIAIINLDTLQVERNISLSFSPCSVRTGYLDRIFVSRMDSIALAYIMNSTSGETLSSINVYLGDRFALHVSPDGDELVTATDGTSPLLVSYWTIVNDTASLVARDDWGLGSNGQQQAVDWENRRIYTASGWPYGIQVLSLDTIQQIGFLDMGSYGRGVALSRDSKEVFGVVQGSLFCFNSTTGQIIGTKGLPSDISFSLGPIAVSYDSKDVFIGSPLQHIELSPSFSLGTPEPDSIVKKASSIAIVFIQGIPSTSVGQIELLVDDCPLVLEEGQTGFSGSINWSLSDGVHFVNVTVEWRGMALYSNWSFIIDGSMITVPSAPTDLMATQGIAYVSMTWNAPVDNGGSAITNYHIYRSTNGAMTYSLIATTPNFNFTNADLIKGWTYQYKISAVNAAGEGANCSAIQVRIASDDFTWHVSGMGYSILVPYPWSVQDNVNLSGVHLDTLIIGPLDYGFTTNVNVLTGTDTSITDTRDYLESIVQGAVSSITLLGATNVEITDAPQYLKISNRSAVVFGLDYSLYGNDIHQVAAYIIDAEHSKYWVITCSENPDARLFRDATFNTIIGSFIITPLPSIPQKLTATPGDAHVVLSWSAPVDAGSSPITNYCVYRSFVEDGGFVLIATPSALSFTDTDLTNSQTYWYKVSAVNTIGEGPKSNNAFATPATTPSTPTLSSVTPGDAQIVLVWIAPESNGGSSITAYRVYRGNTSGSETLLTTLGNVLTYTDAGLTNGQPYFYMVSALNSMGEGLKSNEASVTPATVPVSPYLTSVTPGDAQVSLLWESPPNDGGSIITAYRVYRGTTSGGEVLLVTLGNVLTYTDTSVTNGQTYHYKVSAVNSVGESVLTEEVSATPNASSNDGGDNTMLYIGIGAVAVLAVAGAAIVMVRRKK